MTAAYTDVFLGERHYNQAPMVNWALNNEGACSWEILAQMQRSKTLTDAERRVLEFNYAMGVTAGYTVSFKSVSARSKGAIALTAKRGIDQGDIDAVWEEHGRDIHLINNISPPKDLNPALHNRGA